MTVNTKSVTTISRQRVISQKIKLNKKIIQKKAEERKRGIENRWDK